MHLALVRRTPCSRQPGQFGKLERSGIERRPKAALKHSSIWKCHKWNMRVLFKGRCSCQCFAQAIPKVLFRWSSAHMSCITFVLPHWQKAHMILQVVRQDPGLRLSPAACAGGTQRGQLTLLATTPLRSLKSSRSQTMTLLRL